MLTTELSMDDAKLIDESPWNKILVITHLNIIEAMSATGINRYRAKKDLKSFYHRGLLNGYACLNC